MRGDVVGPSCGHGLTDVGGVKEGERLLDAAQVDQCVDAVLLQSDDGLVFFCLGSVSGYGGAG